MKCKLDPNLCLHPRNQKQHGKTAGLWQPHCLLKTLIASWGERQQRPTPKKQHQCKWRNWRTSCCEELCNQILRQFSYYQLMRAQFTALQWDRIFGHLASSENNSQKEAQMTWSNQRPLFTNNFFSVSSTNHQEVIIYYYDVIIGGKKLFIEVKLFCKMFFPFPTTAQLT